MPVAVGLRNQLFTWQTATTASDGQGGQTVTWATAGTLWGVVEPLTTREIQQAGQMVATLVGTIRTEWRRDFPSVTDRLVFTDSVLGNRTYEIQSVRDPDGQRMMLQLMVSEVET